MSERPDNLTIVTHGWEDAPAHPLRTLRPGPARDSRDPLVSERGLAPVEDSLRVGATLGEGGMGVVRSAIQVSLGREVAVKMVRPEHDRPDARRRVLHEGLVTGALEHPNVIPVHDLRQDEDGRPILVLKRVEGEPWSELIAHPERVTERFSTTDLEEWHSRVLLQVCNAVAFAHARSVLHRDLKPENVMIGHYGEVYVLDWGLAVALPGCAVSRIPQASDARGIAGTPAYMAPEQVRTELPLGVACDIWLLGAIFYELVHGHPPHRPDATLTGEAAVTDALERARSGVVTVNPTLPLPLRRILARAMAPDPADRYPSVDAFRLDLQYALERRQLVLLKQEGDRLAAELLGVLHGTPDPRDVQARLGAVRFAYRRVVASWPEWAPARAGHDAAVTAVARWHLRAGEWAAAELLVGELHTADEELSRVVASARDQDRQRLDRLHQVEDRAAGVRTRAFVIVVMGGVWVLGPLVGHLLGFGYPARWSYLALVSVGLAVAGLGLGYWARDSLSRSSLNRQIQFAMVSAPTIFGLTVYGGWWAGLSPDQAQAMTLLAYCAMTTSQIGSAGRWFVPASVAYGLGFVVASARPDLGDYALSLANLVFVSMTLREGWEHLHAAIAEDLPTTHA